MFFIFFTSRYLTLLPIKQGLSTLSTSAVQGHKPSALKVYVRDYEGFSDAERFAAVLLNRKVMIIYDGRNGIDRDADPGAWVRCSAQ